MRKGSSFRLAAEAEAEAVKAVAEGSNAVACRGIEVSPVAHHPGAPHRARISG